MNDEAYLWDPSAPASPFVEKLEQLLAEKRAVVKATGRRRRRRRALRVVGVLMASAAAVVAAWALALGDGESRPKQDLEPSVAVEEVAPRPAEPELPAPEAETKAALALQEPAQGGKPEGVAEPAAEEAVMIRAK